MRNKRQIVLYVLLILILTVFSCIKKTTEPDNQQTVATPSFNPPEGTYNKVQNIDINCSTSGATIRYTTDGSDPTVNSTVYSSPIIVSVSTTLKAKAFKDGWKPSNSSSTTYTIDISHAEMVLVPGGTFTMGDTRGEGSSSEYPTHSVTLNSFYLGKYEVTQSEWIDIMGSWDSDPNNLGETYGVGATYPVYYVTWSAILNYCNLRSLAEGLTPCYNIDPMWNTVICNWGANGYRLPTEAEWEYAARGAKNTPDYLYCGSDYIDAVAWFGGNNSSNGCKPVGTKAPNGLGLYDMSGNLWEWCWDMYGVYNSYPSSNPTGPVYANDRLRVERGGSWNYSASTCRVSSRYFYDIGYSSMLIGFRLCRAAQGVSSF